MDVKASKSELQSAKERPKFQVATAHGGSTLGSDSTHNYMGVERSFPLYAPECTDLGVAWEYLHARQPHHIEQDSMLFIAWQACT